MFPALPDDLDATIDNLLAVGSFLVSSEFEKGEVLGVRITSDAGNTCRVYNPWPGNNVRATDVTSGIELGAVVEDGVLSFPTTRGHTYSVVMGD